MHIALHGTLRRAKLGLIPGASCCQIRKRLVKSRSQEGHFPNPFEDSFRRVRAAACDSTPLLWADSGGRRVRSCEKSRGRKLSACLSHARCRDLAKPLGKVLAHVALRRYWRPWSSPKNSSAKMCCRGPFFLVSLCKRPIRMPVDDTV